MECCNEIYPETITNQILMEMVKLCVQFFIIKCLGSSAWPERCLGKAKVAGSIPAQGFLFRPKESQFSLVSDDTIDDMSLPNSVRNIEDREIDWVGYQQYLEKNFNKHSAKARLSYSKNYYQIIFE